MPASEIEVVVSKDGEVLLQRTLAPGEYTIGRSVEMDLQVEVELVSRRHARLIFREDGIQIEDLGSSYGTFLDGQPVTAPTLVGADGKIQIGTVTMELFRRGNGDIPSDLRQLLPPEFSSAQKYAPGKTIAQGGMGTILDAHEPAICRTVAMKTMLRQDSREELRRFIEEAQITGQLEHPNIVPVHELGLDGAGQLFYTMKLVKGITLLKVLELLSQGVPQTVAKYPLAELLTIFQKVCDALAFAHSKGVIHRDLKPENVMIGRYGEVLVMDWGIAKLVAPTGPELAAGWREVKVNSAVGNAPAAPEEMILGTPGFMSPEQARGEADTLDARSDVFALGAILYTILTLEFPFDAATDEETAELVRAGKVVPPTQRLRAKTTAAKGQPGAVPGPPHLPQGRVPEALSAVTMKAMALRREDRYQHVEDLQADLAAYQGGFATTAEQAGLARQLWLLVLRNKALAALAAVLFVVINTFALKIFLNERRMAATLAELRGTAPTFQAQAQALIEQGKLDEAAEKIAFAVKLAPSNADYRFFSANTLQAAQKLAPAIAAYREVLTLRPDDAAAQKNLGLCERLLAVNRGGEMNRETQVQLMDALLAQGRRVEAAPLGLLLGKDQGAVSAGLQARIKEYSIQPGWNATRIRSLPNGTFALNLDKLKIGDLRKLEGLPISELSLEKAQVTDLTGIAALPLTLLNLNDTAIGDLAPLRGLKLRTLKMENLPVIDLGPLAGMPLEVLWMLGVRVVELAPLASAPLRVFRASKTPLRDLRPLEKCPLEEVILNDTPIVSLAGLSGKPLRLASFERCARCFDFTPLAGCPTLEELHLPGHATDLAFLQQLPKLKLFHMDHRTDGVIPYAKFRDDVAPTFARAAALHHGLQAACGKVLPWDSIAEDADGKFVINLTNQAAVAEINALRGAPIKHFMVSKTKVSSLTALRGAPLTIVHLNGTLVTDVSLLAEFPALEEVLLPEGAAGVAALKKLPNLKYVSYEWNGSARHPDKTAEQFWKAFDRQAPP